VWTLPALNLQRKGARLNTRTGYWGTPSPQSLWAVEAPNLT
jgi:hypothetical protein